MICEPTSSSTTWFFGLAGSAPCAFGASEPRATRPRREARSRPSLRVRRWHSELEPRRREDRSTKPVNRNRRTPRSRVGARCSTHPLRPSPAAEHHADRAPSCHRADPATSPAVTSSDAVSRPMPSSGIPPAAVAPSLWHSCCAPTWALPLRSPAPTRQCRPRPRDRGTRALGGRPRAGRRPSTRAAVRRTPRGQLNPSRHEVSRRLRGPACLPRAVSSVQRRGVRHGRLRADTDERLAVTRSRGGD